MREDLKMLATYRALRKAWRAYHDELEKYSAKAGTIVEGDELDRLWVAVCVAYRKTGGSGVKAISLWQPWASLIVYGVKGNETRDWGPPKALFGHRIAIHAAKKAVWPIVAEMEDDTAIAIGRALGNHLPNRPRTWRHIIPYLPVGALIGTAVLAEAVKVDEDGEFAFSTTKPDEVFVWPDQFGNYSPGRWVWRLTDVERFQQPILCKGRQRFFDVCFGEMRRPFLVTDRRYDAPDGARILITDELDRLGWWERSGDSWYPVVAEGV